MIMIDKKQYKQRFQEYKKLATEYYNKIPELEKQAVNAVVRTEYSKGREVIHRGFYCPSPVQDRVIGNNKRGKLLKRAPKSGYTYCYGFDADDRLILVTQTTELDFSIKELLLYEGNTVISVEYEYPLGKLEIVSISRCDYEKGKLMVYECAHVNCSSDKLLANVGEILTEEYEYNGDMLSTCNMTKWSCGLGVTFNSRDKYVFNYDENGEIVSYTVKQYDGEKEVEGYWDGYEFPF